VGESNQEYANLGWSVGTAGDVNGDGYDDVIVGAPFYENGQNEEGAAAVYHGSAAGLSLVPNWGDESDQAAAHFGDSVGTAGDVNGDGYDDVIVGASYYDHGQTDEGAAAVYHGSATGLSLIAAWLGEGDQAAAHFGDSVGTAGDVNGDGYDDVIVGANHYYNGQVDEGAAAVYDGSATGLALVPNWGDEGDQVNALFGSSVGTAGDVNGDGYDDVIVGAPNYNNGQEREGAAAVYHGSASGLSLTPNWGDEGDQVDTFLGGSVGTAGDVNGDGFADIIVGAPLYDHGQDGEGAVVVYYGSAAGLALVPNWGMRVIRMVPVLVARWAQPVM
jgi:FG-GAP repeat